MDLVFAMNSDAAIVPIDGAATVLIDGTATVSNRHCYRVESALLQCRTTMFTFFLPNSVLPPTDLTQITLRSELLSQIRGSDVILRDRIHKELGNLINLIRVI